MCIRKRNCWYRHTIYIYIRRHRYRYGHIIYVYADVDAETDTYSPFHDWDHCVLHVFMQTYIQMKTRSHPITIGTTGYDIYVCRHRYRCRPVLTSSRLGPQDMIYVYADHRYRYRHIEYNIYVCRHKCTHRHILSLSRLGPQDMIYVYADNRCRYRHIKYDIHVCRHKCTHRHLLTLSPHKWDQTINIYTCRQILTLSPLGPHPSE